MAIKKKTNDAEKKKPLTVRERVLIKGLAEGLTAEEAMKQAGYAESTAKKSAKSVIGKDRIQEAMNDIMERQGLSDDQLVQILKNGLEAKKVISALLIGKEGMADASEATKDFIEIPDYAVRHKYLETAFKLKGYLRDKIDMKVTTETYEQRLRRRLDEYNSKQRARGEA